MPSYREIAMTRQPRVEGAPRGSSRTPAMLSRRRAYARRIPQADRRDRARQRRHPRPALTNREPQWRHVLRRNGDIERVAPNRPAKRRYTDELPGHLSRSRGVAAALTTNKFHPRSPTHSCPRHGYRNRRESRDLASRAGCDRARQATTVILPACLRRSDPYSRVVKYGASIRETRIGADERVDAYPLFKGAIRPDALDDDDARLQPVKRASMHHNRATPIANPNTTTVRKLESREIPRMYAHSRPS